MILTNTKYSEIKQGTRRRLLEMSPGSVSKGASNSAICVQCYTSFSRAKHAGLFWQAAVSEEERLSESHLPSSGRKRHSLPHACSQTGVSNLCFPLKLLMALSLVQMAPSPLAR